MTISKLVQEANNASSHELTAALRIVNYRDYKIKAVPSSELDNKDNELVWTIFEENMRQLYTESSWGFNPEEKRKEIFHNDSRFLLVHKSEIALNLVAFVVFRFDMEEGEHVLYLYDIQISKLAQRQGLGRILMDNVMACCKRWKMTKAMLTVFNSNTEARDFYRAVGFTLDCTSPGYDSDDSESADYTIMSKTP